LSSPERFQILSLDGGGLKGIFTASFLAEWEKNRGTRVVDSFDLIAGTSTGGIIALALGLGFPAEEIVAFYRTEAANIFPTKRFSRVRQLFRPKYDRDGLRRVLEKYFGDRRLGESTKRLIIPSYSPEFRTVYLYKTAHHSRLQNDYKKSAVIVALSTAAAPTFLPAAVTSEGLGLIDGGIWANNPVMVAVTDALGYLDRPLSIVAALRIGTTNPVPSVEYYPTNAGFLKSVRPLLDFMISAQVQSARDMAEHILGKQRYYEVNPNVAPGDFQLDRLSEKLIPLGSLMYRQHSSNIEDLGFFDHKADPFVPVYELED